MHWPHVSDTNRKWWVLSSITSCVAMTYIDVSVLPVALPTIHREFNTTPNALHWIINGYTLALAVVVLAGGKLGDLFGYRKMFCFGLLLFAIASALCGLSPNDTWLIFSRILQGIGGAILLPTTQAILYSHFPADQRGKAIGIYTSIGSIFLALGPFIGGSLTQYFSWRMIFWINLPIALIGYILAMASVPKSQTKRISFDWEGFIMMGIGLTLVIVPLMQSNKWGLFSPLSLTVFSAGILCILFLIMKERKIPDPLLEISFYKKRSFLAGNLCFVFNQIQIVVTIFWAIYFQTILGYSPLQAGSATFLTNVPLFLSAPFAGYLCDKVGPRIPVVIGFSLILFSLLWFIMIPQPSFLLLIPALIPFGCGLPLVFSPSFTTAMSEIPAEKRSTATAMIITLRQFCSTLGLAIFGSIFVSIQTKEFAKSLLKNPITEDLDPSSFSGLLSQAPQAEQLIDQLPERLETGIIASFKIAYVDAFTTLNAMSAGFTLAGLLIAFIFYRKILPLRK